MTSNNTRDNEFNLAVQSTCNSTVAALIVLQGLKIDNGIEFVLGYRRSTNYRVSKLLETIIIIRANIRKWIIVEMQ